ncbi:uncharacterized protein LOC110037102 [Phalaenopsis equestris]|uniref:uncharacterized protein LOC110037102 n=1 Tax=Phalaenopsis equestris TaxID=78828 RepID=UPI0009E2C30C|nr:uncharacterized protein LOC110037102 [Phalaenopsis equestris]
MAGPDHDKLGLKHHATHFLTISAIPIKKRRFIFPRSPSPPPETQSSPTVECNTTQNRSFSLVQVPSLEASDIPTSLAASRDEGSSVESGFKNLVSGDISAVSKHPDSIEHDCYEKLQSMETIVVQGENGLKDTVSNDELFSLKVIDQHLAPVDHVGVPNQASAAQEISGNTELRCNGTFENVPNQTSAAQQISLNTELHCNETFENVPNQTSAAQQISGNTELHCNEAFENVQISDSPSVRQAQLELQDPSSWKETYAHDPQKKIFTSGPNTDSAQSCLDRSNWDLNMTMDAWEGSMNDLEPNNAGDGEDRSLLGRGPQPNLLGASATNKKPNASPPRICGPRSLSSNCFRSLCTSSKSGGACYNFDTEACLDLHLKPSFMSESYTTRETTFTLGNFDSLKETQFLGLSTMPLSSFADSKFSLCGAVKPEPYHESIELEEMKTEIAGSGAFGLKPIKSEPCEIGGASRITISGVVNSASDAAMKPETVEDESQDSVSAKETRLPHTSAHDHSLLQSANTPLEAVGTGTIALNTKSDSLIKDAIMQIPGDYSHLHKYEAVGFTEIEPDEVHSNDKVCHRTMSAAASTAQSEKGVFCETISSVVESLVYEGRELISSKQASNEGTENADLLITCEIEGQIMNLVSEACQQPHIAAESLRESFNAGTLKESSIDQKAKIDSHVSFSETDSKTVTVVETRANCDVLESNQSQTPSICMVEEQVDNECKAGSPHVLDVVMQEAHEKGGIDDHGYEDGEVKDGALLCANVDSSFTVKIKQGEASCPRGIVDIPVAMSSPHELVKHSITETCMMPKDPRTVDIASTIDPALAADLQESSSVTGDSDKMRTSRTTRKTPRDSLKRDKISERKTRSDRDPTLRVVGIEKKADGSGVIENAGGRAKSFVSPSANETIEEAIDRVRTGRIINLNSASSRKMKPIHERPLSSRVKRGNPAEKFFKRENYHPGHIRDENHSEKFRKTENERRGLACGNRGSGSIHSRVRGGSDYSPLKFRDKQRSNQFVDRNCDPNYMQEQINGHSDFRYSRAINSAAISMASGSDASAPSVGRISRKITSELQTRGQMACRRHSPAVPEEIQVMRHPASEVNPSRRLQRDAHDLLYVTQEKMNRPVPGEMLDTLRPRPHSQFERTDRITSHRERVSLSPVHRRGPPQLPSMRSPRSQDMSPSHWSPHSPSEGFNGQHYAEEIMARRRGSAYGDRLPDGMMEAISSREHNFSRSGREFPRKIQRLDMNDPRQVPGECYRMPFGHGQIHELGVDGEYAVGRRCNEMHAPARYREHCILDDDVENFSFHGEESPPRPYRYHAEGNEGFNEGGNSREFEGRFKNRLGNTSRRYRHIEEQQQHEDGFRHQEGQGWNDSGFNNIRPKRRRY